jgi:hypothetical protein
MWDGSTISSSIIVGLLFERAAMSCGRRGGAPMARKEIDVIFR